MSEALSFASPRSLDAREGAGGRAGEVPFPLRLEDLSSRGKESLEWLGLLVYKCSLHFYFRGARILGIFSRRC